MKMKELFTPEKMIADTAMVGAIVGTEAVISPSDTSTVISILALLIRVGIDYWLQKRKERKDKKGN